MRGKAILQRPANFIFMLPFFRAAAASFFHHRPSRVYPYTCLTVRDGPKHRLQAATPGRRSLPRKVYARWQRAGLRRVLKRESLVLDRRIAALSPAPRAQMGTGPTIQRLVCASHLSMAVASAKSLMLAAGQPLHFLFHDDGSLTAADAGALKDHFPGSRVVMRDEADERAERELAAYPTIRTWRAQNVMPLKLIDVALWAPGRRVTYIDSDVLFFSHPGDLLEASRTPGSVNHFNRDIDPLYLTPVETVRDQLGVALQPCINAGLFVMNRGDLSQELLEGWLQSPVIFPMISELLMEQQLTAMLACASPQGTTFLPATYDLLFRQPVETLVCRHYAGAFRHGFALEGLAHLLNERQFESRWAKFSQTAAG